MGTGVAERLAVFSRAYAARATGFRVVDGEQGPEGIAVVQFAVYGVPDTAPAVGNGARQIIDAGALRAWLPEQPPTVPFMRDHGNAHIFGYVDSSLILGYGRDFAETTVKVRGKSQPGAQAEAHWNLATDEGRNAYERARFDPEGTQFSFRWSTDEVVRSKADGFEHVKSFEDVVEFSQVGFGAQELAGIVDGSLRAGVRALVEAELARRSFAVDGLRGDRSVGDEPDEEPDPAGDEDGSGERHKYHGDAVPRRPTKSLMTEWLKNDDFRDMVKGLLKAAGLEGDGSWSLHAEALEARAFSVNDVLARVAVAAEAQLEPEGGWCYAVEVYVEDAEMKDGWIIAAIRGSIVLEDSDGTYEAIGGGEGWAMYRVPWSGTEPDVDGVPTVFEFDVTKASEVKQTWVGLDQPTRGAVRSGGEWVRALEFAAREPAEADAPDALARFYASWFAGADA